MEFPFGHHHHHSHHHSERRDEEDEYPPPPKPDFGDAGDYPPPQDFEPPPPPIYNRFDSDPEYPPPPVHHASHHHFQPEPGYAPFNEQENFDPVQSDEFPPETRHHYHDDSYDGGSASELLSKPTSRLYTKAETGYSLTIQDGNVVLTRSDENDPYQHWIKDEKFSTRVKDEQGFPSFSLVNKATGQAIKHSIGATYPVQLTDYNPDVLDESVLWTESVDLGDGFRTIRMVNNIRLNMDALNGDENHGGVHEGTTIVLWEWKKGPNQRWKIIPY